MVVHNIWSELISITVATYMLKINLSSFIYIYIYIFICLSALHEHTDLIT